MDDAVRLDRKQKEKLESVGFVWQDNRKKCTIGDGMQSFKS
jgi:hypothetical protein